MFSNLRKCQFYTIIIQKKSVKYENDKRLTYSSIDNYYNSKHLDSLVLRSVRVIFDKFHPTKLNLNQFFPNFGAVALYQEELSAKYFLCIGVTQGGSIVRFAQLPIFQVLHNS